MNNEHVKIFSKLLYARITLENRLFRLFSGADPGFPVGENVRIGSRRGACAGKLCM